MEIKKISFREKNDVQKEWNPLPFGDAHYNACNYDCTEWKVKTSWDKAALGSMSPCHTEQTAKGTIWI